MDISFSPTTDVARAGLRSAVDRENLGRGVFALAPLDRLADDPVHPLSKVLTVSRLLLGHDDHPTFRERQLLAEDLHNACGAGRSACGRSCLVAESRRRMRGLVQWSASDIAVGKLVARHAPDLDGLLLDVGSGSGRLTRLFLSLGYRNVVACDTDPWAGEQLAGLSDVTFMRVDAENPRLPSQDSAAVCVVLIHVVEHVADPFPLLADVQRVLLPDGVCVIVTPDFARAWKSFYEDRTHVKPYTRRSLSDTLAAAGFEVLDVGHVNVRRPFGRLGFLWRCIPALLYSGNALYAVAAQRRRAQPPDQTPPHQHPRP